MHLLVGILFLGISLVASANTDAEALVESVSNRVLQVLTESQATSAANAEELYKQVQQEVESFMDFNAMAKLTLGMKWQDATPEQQQRFTNAYQALLVRVYSRSLLEHTGENLQVSTSRPGPSAEYVSIVGMLVQADGNKSTDMNYDLRLVNGKWQAYNVDIGGVSLTRDFRSRFAAEIAANGLESLITRLEQGDGFDS
ncbi:MAG: ABC transporter substrate-binding protein [Gammaproteobacteria bacterium]|nr:ABC transporter substrate-binding protein [Gammaproteobacteria bacterium]MBU2005690.1 ABC transporter substrate-binding protein [Gammaproteobacteria bacterium]